MFTGFPGVRVPGIRGSGCVIDGTNGGCWKDCAGESVREGDGLRDELAPIRDGGNSNWPPCSSWY